MHKFKRDISPVGCKPYLTDIDRIHNYLTRFSKKLFFSKEWIVFIV